MGALFGSKDPNHHDAPPPSGGENPGELEKLTADLGHLGELLAKANQQIAAYLVRRESQATCHVSSDSASGDLAQQIAALTQKVEELAADGAGKADKTSQPHEQDLRPLLESLQQKLEHMEAASARPPATDGPSNAAILDAVAQLRARLDSEMARLGELLAPPEEAVDDGRPAAGSAEWERAILGPGLADHAALAFQRQQLTQGVLEGNPGACALAGQLLVFQSAPAERLPQLLKDLGEAFYRWQPKTSPGTNPLEEALVEWLRRRCEGAGIYNTIALVHPGERFDAARHTAASRGVEITEVHGWIVLRDNGKVYTKAAVSVH